MWKPMQIRPDFCEKSVPSQATDARALSQVYARYAVKMAAQIKAQFVRLGLWASSGWDRGFWSALRLQGSFRG